ncbi:ClpP/crotonase-like domain-containing protein, partial [Hyaloraphidium curvatum]
ALDHVESLLPLPDPPSAALIITGGPGRFFSNGLMLPQAADPRTGKSYMRTFYSLLARVLAFRVPTVAAVNGHAFAGGCVLATCCDYRAVAPKRGWISMNALIMKAEPGMPLHLILKAKYPPSTMRKMLLLAHRFTAEDALSFGIADAAAADSSYGALLEAAEGLATEAAPMARAGRAYHRMKRAMYIDAYRISTEYTDEEAEAWSEGGKNQYERLAGDRRFAGSGAGKL